MDILSHLRDRCTRGEAIVAGCLSGTSADGIDVVLVRAAAPNEALAFEIVPFPDDLGERVRAVLDGVGSTGSEADRLGATSRLSRDLGLAFGRAARAIAESHGLQLDLVASHGQTVWHHDGEAQDGAATLQLGGGAFVAAGARASAVCDFRQADIARGGEGAPLSALVDAYLFPGLPRPAAILNLGGMANLTYLGAPRDGEASASLLAFDVGPAGSLLDGLARRLLDRPWDEGGAAAAAGVPDREFVLELLSHPFFAARPPKSTGRDTFGERWVEDLLARASSRGLLSRGPSLLLASAVEAIAESVSRSFTDFLPDAPGELVLVGGGARNRTLVQALERRTGLVNKPSGAYGVDADAREALVFAVLGLRFLLGQPSTEPGATGAAHGGILGALHLWQP